MCTLCGYAVVLSFPTDIENYHPVLAAKNTKSRILTPITLVLSRRSEDESIRLRYLHPKKGRAMIAIALSFILARYFM